MRQLINVNVTSSCQDQLFGSSDIVTSDELMRNIRALEDKYSEYDVLKLEWDTDWDDTCISLYGERLETDDEMSRRLVQERNQSDRKMEIERRKYLEAKRLIEEYEKNHEQ